MCVWPWGAAVALLLCYAAPASAQDAPRLKSYNVEAKESSVSGLSAGAFMTVQFHVAHSGTLRGAGVTAGGPYYCAQDSLVFALACLGTPQLIDVDKLIGIAEQAAKNGDIDNTSFMAGNRVFLISGTKDTTVKQAVMDKLHDFYTAFVPPVNLTKNYSIPAAHAQLTDDYGDQCDMSRSPYIDNCNYPSAYIILQYIYGDIKYANNKDMITANLLEFNQTEFFHANPAAFSMDTIAYVYVPTQCQNGAVCRLHIALHGCEQGRGTIGDVFALHAGYNGVAEVNNIIVLYPQVTKTLLTNSQGCWDWWGYTGKDYCFKTGPQISGVKQMLDRVAGTS